VIRGHAWSGASQNDGTARDPSERERRVDRVVPRVALLLVGRLLPLVRDDQADPLERREERRSRADDHVRRAIEDAAPFVEALAGGKRAVQQRHAIAETRDEARDDLCGEDDLRHEDDHALSACQRLGGRTQIDLRLPARGHAVQQEAAAGPEPADDRGERCRLGRGGDGVAGEVLLGEGELRWDPPDGALAFDGKAPSRERARRHR